VLIVFMPVTHSGPGFNNPVPCPNGADAPGLEDPVEFTGSAHISPFKNSCQCMLFIPAMPRGIRPGDYPESLKFLVF